MDDVDLQVVDALLLRDPDVFGHYFVELSRDPHPDGEKARKAEKIFQRYGHPSPFRCFVEDYQRYRRDLKKANVAETAVQTTARLSESDDREDDLEPSRKICVVPPFRKRKRPKPGFDAVGFLLQKRRSEESHRLKFSADEDVRESVLESRATEKEKIGRLAEGVLKRMSDQVDALSESAGYRLLDVRYDSLPES